MDDCGKCEELLQGYLDRELSDDEVARAELHLDGCDYCRRRYRFEETLAHVRPHHGRRAHAAGADGEARAAADDRPGHPGRDDRLTRRRRPDGGQRFRATALSRSSFENGPVAPTPTA